MENTHVNDPPPVNLTASNLFSSNESECERVTKVIGNLPIAVYEGSPRRYGMRHVENNCTHPQLPSAQSLLASPSVYPPRPGFPQRVVCTPSETDPNTSIDNSQFSVSTFLSSYFLLRCKSSYTISLVLKFCFCLPTSIMDKEKLKVTVPTKLILNVYHLLIFINTVLLPANIL